MIKNCFAKSAISLKITATGLLTHFSVNYSPLNTTQQSQKVYYKTTASNQKIVNIK